MNTTTLSHRESEVLHLIAYEHTNQDIASKLYISHHTVDSHRKTMQQKLRVKNTAGLIRRAFELGLLCIGQNQVRTCVMRELSANVTTNHQAPLSTSIS